MLNELTDLEPIEITVVTDDSFAGRSRLDQYLASHIEELSRARVQKLIDDGLVKVNGVIARASLKLKEGDLVEIFLPPPEVLEAVAEDIPLQIIFEDEHMLVINKPAGMVTHPGAGVSSGTLVNAVLYHCQGSLSSIGGVVRPGIVHRLDKDTSGLIMVAKSDIAHKGLSEQLQSKQAKRTYLALLEGEPKVASGKVDAPIGRHPLKRKEMTIVKEGQRGRSAVTNYLVVKNFTKFTLVECRLETGRTHQIRVHMASLNLPVVGDIVYNRKTTGSLEARRKLGLQGQALHAARLSFIHPVTNLLLEFQAELPQDFEQLLAKLK
ncbi:MAG: RluA family pseudouridine synthase [Candidatus Melainabacteria bacterium]|nr:RluA family pseudouridine synthase [Candidatus Melainabacteria bacterium]